MPRDFKPAVNVSPLIRFGRWSFLFLGVTYGATCQNFLQNKENKTKEARDKVKAEREARIAEEKKRYSDAEMKNLNVIFNPPKAA